MIKEKTLFVIGAGASSEFGLPISSGLASDIAKRLDIRVENNPHFQITGDPIIVDCLRQDHAFPDMQLACWAIRDGLRSSPSIDSYIDNHKHDQAIARCGKLAIVSAIIEGERSSNLVDYRMTNGPTLNYGKVMDTWIGRLFILASQGVPKTEVSDIFSNLGLIVFNYDRCVEQILYLLVRDHYRLSDLEAARVLNSLDIVHAYGSVGELPWQLNVSEPVNFGQIAPQQLERVSQGILTFTEAERSSENSAMMKNMVQRSPRLVFLGLSYLPQNLNLIRPENSIGSRDIIGTVYAMSQMDVLAVDQDLKRGGFGPINALRWDPNITCSGFMRNHMRVLQG